MIKYLKNHYGNRPSSKDFPFEKDFIFISSQRERKDGAGVPQEGGGLAHEGQK